MNFLHSCAIASYYYEIRSQQSDARVQMLICGFLVVRRKTLIIKKHSFFLFFKSAINDIESGYGISH